MRSVRHQLNMAKLLVHRNLAGFDFDISPVDRKLVMQQIAEFVLHWRRVVPRLQIDRAVAGGCGRCRGCSLLAQGRSHHCRAKNVPQAANRWQKCSDGGHGAVGGTRNIVASEVGSFFLPAAARVNQGLAHFLGAGFPVLLTLWG